MLLPLESATLTKEDSTQLLYHIASLYNMQNSPQTALKYFDKCAKSDGQNEWKTLCEQASGLLTERMQGSNAKDSAAQESGREDVDSNPNS